MFVKQWMSAPAVVIDPAATVRAADEQMDLHKIRRLAVVEDGKLAGIITRSDCASAQNRDRTVGEVMARSPLRVAPDETLEGAAKLMFQNKVSGLPVVEDGVVRGIITESDVFRALVSMMGFGELGARVQMSIPDGEDVLAAVAKKVEGRQLRSLVTWHDGAHNRWEVVIRLSGEDPATRRLKAAQRRDAPV